MVIDIGGASGALAAAWRKAGMTARGKKTAMPIVATTPRISPAQDKIRFSAHAHRRARIDPTPKVTSATAANEYLQMLPT
jgi:hypothetical protein